MVDPLSVAGVVYPIASNLVTLVKDLHKVYKGVRHAKQGLEKVIKKTEIVAESYRFFSQAIENLKQVKGLASILDLHGNLIETVDSESQKIIQRLKQITEIFWFEITEKSSDTVDRCIAQFEWYKESKKTIPTLFQDMQVLERSMRTIGTLVNTQILIHIYERGGSALILSQVKSAQMQFERELRKLKHARRKQEEFFLQHRLPPTQSPELESFANNILKIVEKGISQLQNSQPGPRGPSTVESRPQSSILESEVRLPATPPLTPPHNSDRGQAFEVEVDPEVQPEIEPEVEVISTSRPLIRRRGTRSEPLQHISPLVSSSSFELHGHNENQGQGKHGAYLQMPPFGPPKFGPRPTAGRPSPDFPGPSSSIMRRQGDTTQRQSHPHSNSRRRNRSDISTYGDEGEVTPTHLTGFIGLPPRSRKERDRGSQ